MDNVPNASWTPQLIFIGLSIFFLFKGLVPSASRTWSWGKVGGKVPLSRTSYCVCGLAFLNIAALISSGPKPPLLLAGLFMGFFLAVIAMGLLDTWVYRRKQKLKEESKK